MAKQVQLLASYWSIAGGAHCIYHRPSLLSNIGMADAEFSALIHTHRGYLLRVAVLHQEHSARRIFRPRE